MVLFVWVGITFKLAHTCLAMHMYIEAYKYIACNFMECVRTPTCMSVILSTCTHEWKCTVALCVCVEFSGFSPPWKLYRYIGAMNIKLCMSISP